LNGLCKSETIPTTPDNEAHNYAERIRARLPRRLRELREAAGMSKHALARTSGISREMIGRVERAKANPSLCVTAQLSHGIGMNLTELVSALEVAEK